MSKKFAALALALSPLCVLAAPQITFKGEVTTQTCVAEVNGQTNSIVLLKTVVASELATPNSTAALTPFTLTVRGCQINPQDLKVVTNFLGHGVTQKGNLGNMASENAAGRVQLQLLDKDLGGNPIILNGVTAVDTMVVPAGSDTASHNFGVQYISEEGGATPGAVQGIVEYSVVYN